MLQRPARGAPRLLLAAVLALVAACSPDTTGPTASNGPTPGEPRFYTYPAALYRSHVELGTPADGSPSNDLILSKRTHTVSYNCARGGPNWVSWNLNRTHFGDAARSSTFTSDASLPSGCPRIVTSDYTNSGYSRGHMVRSEERTWSVDDNKATFQMTNVLPQYQALNGGPWYKLEQHLQSLAQTQGKEMYVISGGYGNRGTLSGAGKVVIPTYTWKIVVIMPYGTGLAQATSTSAIQVIAVKMPNSTSISTQPWTAYKTTVDHLESITGYNFLDRLPDSVESYWEARVL